MQDCQGFDLEEAFRTDVLHWTGGYFGNWPSREHANRLNWWMEFLRDSDYDFEQERRGLTPLLSYALRPGPDTVSTMSLLLSFGANIHAYSNWGENSIHCSMDSTINDDYRDVLERKLRVLIEAGCAIYHCNVFGQTPSDLAIERGYWEEWCMALESNGLDVNEVLLEDERRESNLSFSSYESECSDNNGLEGSDGKESEQHNSETLHQRDLNDDRGNSHESIERHRFWDKKKATKAWLCKKAFLIATYNEFKACLLSSLST